MLHRLPLLNPPLWKNPLQSLLKLAPRKRPLPSRYFNSLFHFYLSKFKFLWFFFFIFKEESAAVGEEKPEATPEAAPASEEVAAPAVEESKQEEVDAPVEEAVASEVETQPAQPVSFLHTRHF